MHQRADPEQGVQHMHGNPRTDTQRRADAHPSAETHALTNGHGEIRPGCDHGQKMNSRKRQKFTQVIRKHFNSKR
ncbi:hypothetical protein D3C85_1790840 [compost metagenome]